MRGSRHRVPRLVFKGRRGTHQDLPRLFAPYVHRPARVIIDPRLGGAGVGPMLAGLVGSEHVEVGTVGPDPDCSVQIHPADRERDGVSLTRGQHGGSAIHPLSRLEACAAAWAGTHAVDAEELTRGFVLTEAAAAWEADLFITRSAALTSPAGKYTRGVQVVTEADATILLALLLRSRGECHLGNAASAGGMAKLPPWWFYRVGAWAALPEVRAWKERWPTSHPPTGAGDWAGLRFYDDPLEGVVGRFARALRARDRVLAGMLGVGSNESHDLVLYEAESLALQLSGALDAAASAAGQQLGLTTAKGHPLKRDGLKLHRDEFRDALQQEQPAPPGSSLDLWRDAYKLLGLIRNRIHGAPTVPIAGNLPDGEGLWLVLPEEDQACFHALAQQLGGITDWGARASGGFEAPLIDPWVLTEKAADVTREVLQDISRYCSQRLPPPNRPESRPWPWDQATADSALLQLGL